MNLTKEISFIEFDDSIKSLISTQSQKIARTFADTKLCNYSNELLVKSFEENRTNEPDWETVEALSIEDLKKIYKKHIKEDNFIDVAKYALIINLRLNMKNN